MLCVSEAVSSTVVRRHNRSQTVRYTISTEILLFFSFFVHQTTTHPLTQNEGTTHPIPQPVPPPPLPTSTHLTKTLKLHFFPLFKWFFPSSFRCVIVFFSSVSKSFLTESTQCQHFCAAWWLLHRIFYCVLIWNCSYVCSMLLYNFIVMQLT